MAAATDAGPRVDAGSRLIHLALAVGGVGAVATSGAKCSSWPRAGSIGASEMPC